MSSRRTRSKSSSNNKNNEGVWKDPSVEITMFEAMEQYVPVECHRAFSCLNIHFAIKEENGVSVPVSQIEEHLLEMYNLKTLDKDRGAPLVDDDVDSIPFELPFEVEDEKKEKPKKKTKN
ncbi:hypothetical protein ABK040_014686 [Willaertia magna]